MKPIFSNKLSSQFRKIFWITVVWALIAFSQFVQGHFTLHQFNCALEGVNMSDFIMGSLFTGILAGLLGGSMIVFLYEKWLRTKTYGRMLFLIFLSFSAAFFIVSISAATFFYTLQLGLPLSDSKIYNEAFQQLFKLETVFSYFFWLTIVLITTVVFQINDKYGPGVFKDFLLGKYFHPRKEERIFMFFDMRSSTTIAEKLGEEKYFNLVRELFSDATMPIVYSKGEIYQYVGDEIVISWKMENGIEQSQLSKLFF